ncbi:MAG: sensor histidine kinase [Bacteroidales bacterium]|nr:MAG: sensor histidine kinase [Bacteroidales bacterium]
MSLKIALLLSVILQFATAIIALTLIKRTRTNIAWWLISVGFLLMAIRRLFELFQVFTPESTLASGLLNSWIGISISILMLVSLSFIKRIFNIQKRFEELKKRNEGRVFSAIIRTEENQKQQFSKELHDGLGPLLSSVKMAISAVAKNQDVEKSNKILVNAENLIDESIRTVKEISNNLSPHILNNFGLHRAVKSFLNKLQISSNPRIIFNSNIGKTRFSYNIETVVYRVICELITNTFKHAEANNIYLDILQDTNTLNIKYLDDGKGFEFTDDLNEQHGIGLTNIQSRIKSVQGSCQIFSKPDEGFNINIVINTD